MKQLRTNLSKMLALQKLQSTCRQNHCVDKAVIRLSNYSMNERNRCKDTILVLLDLSAHLDTVDRGLLINDLLGSGTDEILE